MITPVMTRKKLFHSCESVGDVIFDLDGHVHAGLGWVVFELDDKKRAQVTGAIGLSNNVFTLQLLRHLNAQQPLRIEGRFSDSTDQGSESYALDHITPLGSLLSDEIGFILFRAAALHLDVQT